jgi:hypothetical protein
MLKMSRCLLTACAAGSISLAATAGAQEGPATGPSPSTTPAPAVEPAPAPATTYTETTTTQTVTTPAERTNTETAVAVYPESRAESSRTYVDSADDYTYPNRRMLSAGAGLLAISYVPSVIVAAAGDHEDDRYLYYPVAGPWLYLKRQEHDAGSKAMLVIDGIVQDLAALEILLSFVVPQRENRARWYAFGDKDVRVVPGISQHNAGLFASGRF